MFINNFDPVALEIFSLEIRWYSLAYIFGILIGWILSKKFFISDENLREKFDDFITSKSFPSISMFRTLILPTLVKISFM